MHRVGTLSRRPALAAARLLPSSPARLTASSSGAEQGEQQHAERGQAAGAVHSSSGSGSTAKAAPSSGGPDGSGSPQQPPRPPAHWLDAYFPSVRPWLEERNRRYWLKGLIEARPKEFHQLQGHEELLRGAVEREYVRLLEAHAHRAVDARAETHLQVAALALATHRALLPFLRDEPAVLEVIGEHSGGKTSPALRVLLRLTRWLHRDGFATLAGRLRGLQLDYGAGFETRLDKAPDGSAASLAISRCFYRDLFEAEGVPQLTACCCCSQDRVWLEGASYTGVEAGLVSSMAAGDAECCFRVSRAAPVPMAPVGGSDASG